LSKKGSISRHKILTDVVFGGEGGRVGTKIFSRALGYGIQPHSLQIIPANSFAGTQKINLNMRNIPAVLTGKMRFSGTEKKE